MKKHFPLLSSNVIYLDSAATTQKPQVVIDAVKSYYETANANIHRGLYDLSIESTRRYDAARATIATFLNAQPKEIIFTSGTTAGLNLLASVLPAIIDGRNEIVLTELEHHANIIPWQELAKRNGMKIKYIRLTPELEIDYEHAHEIITENTAIVSFAHISNALGTIIDAKRLIHMAKQVGALSIIDAAQSIAHIHTDVKDLDCDFLVFSGHKAYGPTGIGVLYAKHDHLQRMPPYQFGGDMIKTVTFETATYADAPEKFEAGTPNIAGAIGLATALTFISKTGWDQIVEHDAKLMKILRERLDSNPDIKIYSPSSSTNILSFSIDKIHPHDVASILSERNVCVRAGHHCAMPLMHKLGVPGLCRVSIGIYNTPEDIDKLAEALERTKEVFA